MRVSGMSTKFPANSLLRSEIFNFWAKFDGFADYRQNSLHFSML